MTSVAQAKQIRTEQLNSYRKFLFLRVARGRFYFFDDFVFWERQY
jgi:hypothetical protein